MKEEQAAATERLLVALETLAEVNGAAVDPLILVAHGNECEWMKVCLPETENVSEAITQAADIGEAAARLRPAARRLMGSRQ